MATGFHDIQFPNDIAQGAIGGPVWDTTIVPSTSGYEQRNTNWDQSRRHWEISHDVYSEAKLNTLLAFFHARQGRAYAFRFKDWSDYYVGMSFVNDQLSYTSTMQFATGDGATTVFQLTKTYADSAATHTRKITRPVAGSVRIYVNGLQQSTGFTVDYTTGLVTFTTAPTSGVLVQWAGQFDCPARFDTDAMSFNLIAVKKGDWGSIPIIEIRE